MLLLSTDTALLSTTFLTESGKTRDDKMEKKHSEKKVEMP